MVPLHWYIRFGYSVKKNSFKGLDIDCIQYSNIIRITYYSYSCSGTILNPKIIRIRIRPNICARILSVFVFAHSEKTNIIRIRIRSKKQYLLTSETEVQFGLFFITYFQRYLERSGRVLGVRFRRWSQQTLKQNWFEFIIPLQLEKSEE